MSFPKVSLSTRAQARLNILFWTLLIATILFSSATIKADNPSKVSVPSFLYSTVGFDQACSYYSLSFDKSVKISDFEDALLSFGVDSVKEDVGVLNSGSIEFLTNETFFYNVTDYSLKEVYVPLTIDNFSENSSFNTSYCPDGIPYDSATCVYNESYISGSREVSEVHEVWAGLKDLSIKNKNVLSESSKMVKGNAKFSKLLKDKNSDLKSSKNVVNFRICGSYTPTNGRVAIDHIPVIEGIKHPEWAWWNASYDTKILINCSGMTAGTPLVVNGSAGFNLGSGQQLVWTNCQENLSVYYFSTNTSIWAIANDTSSVNWKTITGNNSGNNPANVFSNTNLITYFGFDENSTTSKLYDYSEKYNTSGFSTFIKTGNTTSIIGNSIWTGSNRSVFPQTSINVTDLTNVDIKGNFTHCGWYYVPSWLSPDWQGMFWKAGSDYVNGLGVLYNTATTLFNLYSGSATVRAHVHGTIPLNSWTQICLVFNQTYFTVYFNETLINTSAYSSTDLSDTSPLPQDYGPIGLTTGSGYNFWGGYVDEVSFWNSTKSTSEINNSYQNYKATVPVGFGSLGNLENTCSANMNISTCSVLSCANTIYNLTADITDSAAAPNCMDITADNVTLNCQGHTIDGTDTASTYGVIISRASATNTNATVKNCVITDWEGGLYTYYAKNNTFTNNTANSNLYGIYLSSSSNNTIANSTANSNNYGIYLSSSSNNNVTGSNLINNSQFDFYVSSASAANCNNVLTNVNGTDNKPIVYYNNTAANIDGWNNVSEIVLCGATNSVINNVNISRITKKSTGILLSYTTYANITKTNINNSYNGIYLSSSSNNIIANLTANSNNRGIFLGSSSNNNIIANSTANSNYNYGIYLLSSSNNAIANSTANSNSNYGIYLGFSSNNAIANSTANSNNYGIYLLYSSNTIANSTANSNNYGIYLLSSSNNTIYSNTIKGSSSSGVYLSDAGNNGPNTFYNNFLNNTNNTNSAGTVYLNYWNTTNQAGTRIFSSGTNISGNYWTNSSGTGYSDTCTDANTDGFCDSPYNVTTGTACTGATCGNNTDYLPLSNKYVPDIISPVYSLNSTNSTLAGTSILHNLYWTDNVGLSGYIFSFYNGTAFVNDSWVSMSGTAGWSNVSKIVNSTVGATIEWCVYANDSSNNWNSTSCITPFSYTTTTDCLANVNISTCSVLSCANTIYNLTADITDSAAAPNCMDITADNVTLNCQGHTIDGTDTASTYGVIISRASATNTNATVKNCVITDWASGLYTFYAQNNTFTNNTANSNSNYGIYLFSSSNNAIANSTANSNLYGIYLTSSSNNNIIANSTANSNTNHGIFLSSSSNNNIIANSTANSNNYGIYLTSSSNNNVTGSNLINNSPFDFYVSSASAANCNNVLTNVNGTDNKPIVYYNNTAANIDGWNNNVSEIVLCGATNSVINNVNISRITKKSTGILLSYTTYANITKTNINNSYNGIYLFSSSNNIIANSTANLNNVGIYLTSNSNNNIIANSTANLNTYYYGIFLSSSSNNIIANSTANSNLYGIYLTSSSNNTIANSTANSNAYGIYLTSSSNNTIYSNTVKGSSSYGFFMESAGPNTFYNNFLNNTNNTKFSATVYPNYWNTTNQAGTRIFSSGTNISGNYWTNSSGTGYSDTCTDADTDGFCDSPYNVTTGTACTGATCGNNTDYLPLSNKYVDSSAPVYSLNSTNSTLAGTSILHNLYWTDNVGLSGYIFSFYNGTAFVNDSWVSMSGTAGWSNVSKIVNSTVGATIEWCVYANDSSNNWNSTSCITPFSYTTTTDCLANVNISTCSVLSCANTIYNLTADITDSAAMTCMNISADNVTLNCQGHTIDGLDTASSYGIYSNGIKNFVMNENCVISDWTDCVRLTYSNNSFFSNFTTSSCSIGIRLLYSNANNSFSNFTSLSNTNSNIYLLSTYAFDSNSNNIFNNFTSSSNSGYGVNLGLNSINNSFTNFNSSNVHYGISVVTGSNNNSFSNFICSINQDYGIYLSFANNNSFNNFTASGNGDFGVSVVNSYNNSFSNFTISGKTWGVNVGANAENNSFNDGFLNNTNNSQITTILANFWNSSTKGNFWALPNGGGFSETCGDSNHDGICNFNYTLNSLNIDYLPQSLVNQPPQMTTSLITLINVYNLSANCTGSDADSDALSYYYLWYVNNAVNVTTQNVTGALKGQNWKVSCRAFDGTANSTWQNSSGVTINNSIPTTPSSLSLNASIFVIQSLIANASGSTDADSDTITYYYEFYNVNDSAVKQAYSTTASYSITTADAHDLIQVRAWAWDGTDNSSTYKESNITVSNTAPVLGNPTINDSNPYITSSLSCTAGSYSDADSDAEGSKTWLWFVNNAATAVTTQTFTISGNAVKGNTIICQERTSDGLNFSNYANSSAVTVLNSIPAMTTALISPVTAYINTNLSANCTGSDADADVLTYYYQWYRNDTLNVTTQNVTVGVLKNQGWKVSCRVYDGTANSTSWLNSSVLTISNSVPVVGNNITFSNSSLIHSFNATASVIDSDGASDISLTNVTITSGSCSQLSNSSSGTNFTVIYNCSGTAYVSTNVTIGFTDKSNSYVQTATAINGFPNHIPTLGSPSLNNTVPKITDVIKCNAGSYSDSDGDAEVNASRQWRWYKNNVLTGISTQTFTISGNAVHGDVLKCEERTYDGYDYSSWVNSSNTATVQNTIPLTPSSLTLNGSIFVTQSLVANASGSTDADSDSITYYYEFYNVNNSAVRQAYSTTASYTITTADAHDLIQVRAWAWDGTDNSSTYKESNITVSNSLPTIPTTLTQNSTLFIGQILIVNGSGSTDADSDSITYYYEFYNVNDSAVKQAYSTTANYTIGAADVHNTIRVRVWAWDTITNSSSYKEGNTTINNSIPTTPTTLTLNGTIFVTQSLVAAASGSSDADSDSLTYYYEFYNVNNSVVRQAYSTTASYSIATADAHDLIRVRSWAWDGTANSSTYKETNITAVSNSVPSLGAPSINNTSPGIADIIKCNAGSYSDADSDTEGSQEWRWYKNNALTGISTQTFTISGNAVHGDVLKCEERTYDGYNYSIWTNSSNTANVANAIPTTPPSLTLNGTIFVTQSLVANASGSTDADSDSITYYYEFYNVNNSAIRQAYSTTVSYTIAVADAHDLIRVRAWAYDGFTNSTTYKEANITVSNTIPILGTPAINNTVPKITDVIMCNAGSYSDADSDAEGSREWRWYKNNVLTGISTQTFTISGNAVKSDVLKCEERTYDGYNYSIWINSSNTATVQNTIPTISSISISPTSINSSENVSVSFTCSDADSDLITGYVQAEGTNRILSGNASVSGSVNIVALGDWTIIPYCNDTSTSTAGASTSGSKLQPSISASEQLTFLNFTNSASNQIVWLKRLVTLNNSGSNSWSHTLGDTLPNGVSSWKVCEGNTNTTGCADKASGSGSAVSYTADQTSGLAYETILYKYDTFNFSRGAWAQNGSASEAVQNFKSAISVQEPFGESVMFSYDISGTITGESGCNCSESGINANGWAGNISTASGDWIGAVSTATVQNASLISSEITQYFNGSASWLASANLPASTTFTYALGSADSVLGATCTGTTYSSGNTGSASATAGNTVLSDYGISSDCITENFGSWQQNTSYSTTVYSQQVIKQFNATNAFTTLSLTLSDKSSELSSDWGACISCAPTISVPYGSNAYSNYPYYDSADVLNETFGSWRQNTLLTSGDTAYITANLSINKITSINFTSVQYNLTRSGWSCNSPQSISINGNFTVSYAINCSKTGVVEVNSTLAQLPGISGSRVSWAYSDTWRNTDASVSFINLNRTYALPSSCSDVTIFINGTNHTISSLVSNSGCTYYLSWNVSLSAGEVLDPDINYTTTGVIITEGTSTQTTTAEINKMTGWENTLTISNPTTLNYSNISVNLTLNPDRINTSVKIYDANNILYSGTRTLVGSTLSWNASVNASRTDVWKIYWNTTAISNVSRQYDITIGAEVYRVTEVNISTLTTPQSNIKAYTLFNDSNITSSKLYECLGSLTNCTDLTADADTSWTDNNTDGKYDYVLWYIDSLNGTKTYEVRSGMGFAINVTEDLEILNAPIKTLENIKWRNTITVNNPNSFGKTVDYKLYPPLSASTITLDGVSKQLVYPSMMDLRPFIMLSEYVQPNTTKVHTLLYQSYPVTESMTRIFPTEYWVNEPAKIVINIMFKNWVEDNVTDVEMHIAIDYGINLSTCAGEVTGCGSGNVSEDLVNGDFKFEIPFIEALASDPYTIQYYVPTAVVDSNTSGRRSIEGVLYGFKQYNFRSTAPFTLNSVFYASDLKCADMKYIQDDIGSTYNYTCADDLAIFELREFKQGDVKKIYAFYAAPVGETEQVGVGLISQFLNYGKTVYTFTPGTWQYLCFSWLYGSIMKTGQLIFTLMFIILACVILALLYIKTNRTRISGKFGKGRNDEFETSIIEEK